MPTKPLGFPRLAALRREAGLTVAECASYCGFSASSYRRLEAGTLGYAGSRDEFGLIVKLARLLSERLGRPVSAQWDLCGPLVPPAQE